jgi:hypothetical protein
MASLISTGEKATLTGIFNDIFDTFKRDIVVYKEPIKTVASINESNLFGYGDASNQVNYTYAAQSGTYQAIIRYADQQQQDYYSDLNGAIAKGDARIKVKKECRDFIENGRTEKIEFDGKSWNVVTSDSVRRFLDSEFFVYHLERAK